MLSLCNYNVVMALQVMDNMYFCIVTLQLYHSLICLWSILKEIIVCIFFYLFVSFAFKPKRAMCIFNYINMHLWIFIVISHCNFYLQVVHSCCVSDTKIKTNSQSFKHTIYILYSRYSQLHASAGQFAIIRPTHKKTESRNLQLECKILEL
jgi:hypothetical protein